MKRKYRVGMQQVEPGFTAKLFSLSRSRWFVMLAGLHLAWAVLPAVAQNAGPSSDKAALAERVRHLELTLANGQAQLDALRGSLATVPDSAEVQQASAGAAPQQSSHVAVGGRGVIADCHDASDATGGESSDPHCWAGGHLKGISAGLDKRF